MSKLGKMLEARNKITIEREKEMSEGSYTGATVDIVNSPAFDIVNAPLPGAKLIKINIDDIESSPVEWNFFIKQSEDHVMNLAISLKNEGQFSPIIIREQIVTANTKKWQNLAGHTRHLAARYLRDEGYTDFQYLWAFAYPLDVCSDIQAQRIIVHSNTEQRHSLTAEEKQACFYFQYCDERNNDRNQTAKDLMEKLMDRYKIKRSQAYNLRSIGVKLIPEFRDMLQIGAITVRNALVLVKFEEDIQKWLIRDYKDKLTRDNIPQIAGKSQEEIQKILTIENVLDDDIKKHLIPHFFKKVQGGSLAKIFVIEGKEEEFLKLIENYYTENGM